MGVLRTAFPDHAIVSEESPPHPGEGAYCWYVDPLDGTTNFAHGYPHCAVSIALERDGATIFGLVHDPLRRETFSAHRGSGSRLNGRPIRVSSTDGLEAALVATGFPYDRRERAPTYARFVEIALQRARCVRRSGSAALDLCYVACGRLDAYWEWRLGPWDAAAGALIVREAGGRVTNLAGAAHALTATEIVASNGPLHVGVLAMLHAAVRDPGRAHGS